MSILSLNDSSLLRFSQAPSNPRNVPVLQTDTFSSMTTSLKGSAGRLTRMAASGNKVAVLKLAGIIIAFFIFLYYMMKLFF